MRSRDLKRARATRGMTLLEAMVAALVLTIGIVAIFGTLTRVQGANRAAEVQTEALDAFGAFAAEIRNARCDYVQGANPGLDVPVAGGVDPALTIAGWQLTPPVGGSATQVGLIQRLQGVNQGQRVHLAFRALSANDPRDPANARSRIIEVVVQPVPEDGLVPNPAVPTINQRRFTFTKNCSARSPISQPRGEYP